jgi:hypothetical protein
MEFCEFKVYEESGLNFEDITVGPKTQVSAAEVEAILSYSK